MRRAQSNAHRLYREKASSAFSLTELILVIALIGTITVFSAPVLTSFSNRGQSLDGASQLMQRLIRAQSQAIRRSRAIEVELGAFSLAGPSGVMTLFEGRRSSCVALREAPEERRRLSTLLFGPGQDPLGRESAYPALAMSGWRIAGGALSQERLSLCLSPRGVILREDGGDFRPFEGSIELLVQSHLEAGAGGGLVPPRSVLIPFSGGPRLALER
ncbi:MAG: hypothetical protein VYD19_01200 [Myxococcota bacterium]|nr:hypothetical protein [Myxococcota bacterium]